MNVCRRLLASLAVVSGLALAPQAQATLTITGNGDVLCTDPTNTACFFNGVVDGFNINVLTLLGINAFGGSGTLMDIGSLNVSTDGSGSLTLLFTQTNLDTADGATIFGTFTGTLNNLTATREFFLDSTNSGLLTTLMGSTSAGGASTFSYSGAPSGLFSITERITIIATGPGALLSSDDTLRVPEPGVLALLGLGLLGVAVVRRRKQ